MLPKKVRWGRETAISVEKSGTVRQRSRHLASERTSDAVSGIHSRQATRDLAKEVYEVLIALRLS